MTNRVVHFEIPFDDGDRARTFYGDVFGWQVMPVPEMEYTLVTTGPTDREQGPSEVGFINGGLLKRQGDWNAPNIVIDVDNIEHVLKSIGEHGGSAVQERQAVGDMGFAAYFKDSEGNLIGLWESASGS
jgi:predicted enzyme related to lactoylglutathione lyase